MTDNRNDSQKTQSQKAQSQNSNAQNSRPQAQAKQTPSNLTAAQKTAEINAKVTKAAEPQLKKVDIVIAGIAYQIYCPVHEEEELRSAVYYINNFVLDIKKDATNLGQEKLLLLCCLDLYEKIHAHKKTNDNHQHENQQSEALLRKIITDAQSIL